MSALYVAQSPKKLHTNLKLQKNRYLQFSHFNLDPVHGGAQESFKFSIMNKGIRSNFDGPHFSFDRHYTNCYYKSITSNKLNNTRINIEKFG